ncbi:NAD(P)-dependent oxidoreductase [Variovorax arabinosiphilus]|uniref:NAD(P)-dependent oxidoreductase n=1 Tax=Variovorax arabinosiphilus TaxID=3053498 RepID=UPI0025771F6A|nr:MULTISPECIES: NAD(P)-dependent oxidoreductase [unclassified Variovorax]MDM0123240.1 NAD(P)-dependent oxidoreductase [Variovorax sp. J2L1-78]MDM0131764.1 NAD(P)-dependent oxidoreductase [Variovorax sp. J2L1-63]MDM0236003.1 NAD(P)-dependent oxidoreductase [Variovorax sp. J2R1-6]
MENIGLVGVGLMGHGIASNIVKHGHPLSVLEHPGNQPLDTLKAAGVKTFATASELAAAVDVVILCVTGTPQVEAVLLGDTGVLKGMQPGTIIIDCSTALPDSTERLAKIVADAGGRFIDAAMTRTPKEAAEGRLNLLVGGDAELFRDCRPLLACFAENITHAGPVGAGHRMKLLHNYVSLGSVALIAEAAACAERAGVDPEVFIDVLVKGGGGGTALERLRPFLMNKDPNGLRFAMSNALKDLGYYTAMAEASHSARSIAEGVRQTLEGAVQGSDPQALMPELVAVLAKRGDGV